MEREGGISPHVSPMAGALHHSPTELLPITASAEPRDMSNLMSRAGFTLLTVDVDEVSVGYPSMWELLEDLRDMGENNAIIGRCAVRNWCYCAILMIDSSRHLLHRDTLASASAIYKGRSKSLGQKYANHPDVQSFMDKRMAQYRLRSRSSTLSAIFIPAASSPHSQCKCRLDGNPRRSSLSHWKEVREKQISKMFSNEIMPLLPPPCYPRSSLQVLRAQRYLGISALGSPHIMTAPSLLSPPI
jgi:hypothetical protein